MTNDALQSLALCGDVRSLESTLVMLCSEYGSLSQMDILTMIDSGKRQAVCLLRLHSSEQQKNLMLKLGAIKFGEDLCVVVDLQTPEQQIA